ncbi:alpha/beta-hydrolase [Aspergillus floccosus]
MPGVEVYFLTYDGLNLAGTLHGAGEKHPCIIMSNEFSGLRSEYLPEFAKRFNAVGYTVLLYDNRTTLGDSEGKPRNEVDSVLQTRDYYDAFNYTTTLSSVDPKNIVYWGSSMSGGNALVATAVNKCVKGVIAQVPVAAAYCEALPRDRANFVEEFTRQNIPWEKLVSLQSLLHGIIQEPRAVIHRIAPRPLLMVVAEQDVTCPVQCQLSVFNEALHPMELKIIKGASHFDPYYGPPFEENIKAQLEFLRSVFE